MDIDALSEAMKAADITQEGGRGVLDENPVNLLQGEEGAIGGTSPDQKVQRRKNSKSGKRVKKRKSKGMVLRAIGEENEQIESENDSMMRRLQLMQDDREMQKTEFCASQNKIIAAQENCVEKLYQKLQLMGDLTVLMLRHPRETNPWMMSHPKKRARRRGDPPHVRGKIQCGGV